jgi:geranylgeranyl pyrophosphate synthase
LGIAFQLQDVLFRCFGDPETFWKTSYGDIIENKKPIYFKSKRIFLDGQKKNPFIFYSSFRQYRKLL